MKTVSSDSHPLALKARPPEHGIPCGGVIDQRHTPTVSSFHHAGSSLSMESRPSGGFLTMRPATVSMDLVHPWLAFNRIDQAGLLDG